jgi:hypothetical protein
VRLLRSGVIEGDSRAPSDATFLFKCPILMRITLSETSVQHPSNKRAVLCAWVIQQAVVNCANTTSDNPGRRALETIDPLSTRGSRRERALVIQWDTKEAIYSLCENGNLFTGSECASPGKSYGFLVPYQPD